MASSELRQHWFQHIQSHLFGKDPVPAKWLEECHLSCSSVDDTLTLAYDRSVFVVRRSHGESIKTYQRFETITALTCIPTRRLSDRSHSMWNAIVIGYDSGVVEVLDQNGETILKRSFAAGPVKSLYCATKDNVLLLETPYLTDLLVVYPKTLVALSAKNLQLALHHHQAKLAVMKSTSEELDPEVVQELLQEIDVKIFHTKGDQEVTGACVMRLRNVEFDQLNLRSLSNQTNETKLRALATKTTIITIGTDPFIEFNNPYNLGPTNINDLAENVMSTVKSGIAKMATDFLWGSAKVEEPPKKKDPEFKLTIAQAFKDHLKTGLSCQLSPNKFYLAIADNQNRILVLDTYLGAIIHVWKGYHHAQFAWIVSKKETDSTVSTCLLVIYLPRRGSLEIWSVEQKNRIAEFTTCKGGKLIPTSNAILDPDGKSPMTCSRNASFLSNDGTICEIIVPIESTVDQSLASHDLIAQKKLGHALLHSLDDRKDEELQAIVHSTRTAAGTQVMLNDLASCKTLNFERTKRVTLSTDKLAENSELLQHVLKFYHKAFAMYEYILENEIVLSKAEKTLPSTEEIKDAFNCGSLRADSILARLKMDPNLSVSVLHFSELFQALDTPTKMYANADAPPDCLNFSVKMSKSSAVFETLCLLALADGPGMAKVFLACNIQPQKFLEFVIGNSVHFQFTRLAELKGFKCLLSLIFNELFPEGSRSKDEFFDIGRRRYHHTQLNSSLYLSLFIWNDYILGEEYLQENLVDSSRSLLLTDAFLHIEAAFGLTQTAVEEQDEECHHTLENVFNVGDGRLPELVAFWMVDRKTVPEDFEAVKEVQFTIAECSKHFPKTMESSTLVPHLAWEYFRRWNIERADIFLLENGVKCLDYLNCAHKLTTLIWQTFLCRVIRDCVNVTENRSNSRCLRDIGIQESKLGELLIPIVKAMRIMLRDEPEEEDVHPYDDISIARKQHLLEHLKKRSPSLTSTNSSNDDEQALHYQFAVIICNIWNGSFANLKPLDLFSSQETNIFFQGESRTHHSWSLSFNQQFRHVRKKFLSQASDWIVSSYVRIIPGIDPSQDDEDGGDPEFLFWSGTLALMAKMWFLTDIFQEQMTVALYRHGYDSLGADYLTGATDQQRIGGRLLHVALLRLTKYVYESEDHNRKVALIKSELMTHLSQLTEEAAGLPQMPLEAIQSLLMHLCGLDLDPQSQQLTYECLALVQSFMR